ncbi:purple acid phosphatase 28 [Wolffia australiana]
MAAEVLRVSVFLVFLVATVRILENLLPPELTSFHRPVPRVKIPADLPLRFRPDGTFKILQVADLHYGTGEGTRCRDVAAGEWASCSDANSTGFLARAIRAERPDLVVFTGDNIFGPSARDAAESLFAAFRPAADARVAWAAVLGNHDHESSLPRPELMPLISLMDRSVSLPDPPGVDGFGNYALRVAGARGSALANSSALRLYFLDSGDRELVAGRRTYGWIKPSQLRWLRAVAAGRRRETAAGLAFFHIPLAEVRGLWGKAIVGEFQEGVACSAVNAGALETMKGMGHVKAAFAGHDHLNDFCGDLGGVMFCYGGGFGYHGYGRPGWARRARVILAELGSAGVARVRTWKHLDDPALTLIDEQVLWEDGASSI